jgi:hypothetical protein
MTHATISGTQPFDESFLVHRPRSYVAADPNGPLVYIQAGNGAELDKALESDATDLCCDCVK